MSGVGAAIAGGIASAGAAAASGIANTLINYGANKDLQHDSRVFNSAEAQKQRDWEQYMASTQYQRMIKDMEAAGINPASMSGVSGQPNSVPSGSSASSSAPGFSSNTFGDFNALINSAVQGMFAKDRNAAYILAHEVQDNAKHGYRMEEIREREEAKQAREAYIASRKSTHRKLEISHEHEQSYREKRALFDYKREHGYYSSFKEGFKK